MKLMISFVYDSLSIPAGLASWFEVESMVFEGSKRSSYFLVKE
jgi:hypothetical protein